MPFPRTGLIRSLLPRGVAGWTLLILINVLLLMAFAQFVMIRLVGQEVSNFIERDTIADRVFVMEKMFRTVSPDQWPALVASIDQPNFHVSLTKPDPRLLEERAKERPLLEIAADATEGWNAYSMAEQARNRGDMESAKKYDAIAREVALKTLTHLKPLAVDSDRVLATVARDQIEEIDYYFRQTELERFGQRILQKLFAIITLLRPEQPNTAVFVPARAADMPPEIYVAMEIHAQRLMQSSSAPKSRRPPLAVAVTAQRVSPFVRAWFGPNFDNRPYLERAPDNPRTLRVVLPLSADQWITIDAGTAESVITDFTPYVQVFVIAGILVLIITGWAITRLTAPIARFAEATERLGRDVNAPAVELTGPSEVRKAAAAFNEMQARIQAYVRDRTTMLAAISHDLRTPLTRLRLRGEFIEEDQQEKYFRDLDEMEAMITAAMDFARDEAKSEETVPIDVASLCRALALDMHDGGKSVTCLYEGPSVVVEVRPMAFRRALMNLLENAVTYGGAARIGLTAGPQKVEITIDDDGPGIPPEQAEQVFAPFYRIETSRNRRTGGVGLGLATVRSVIRSHGGDVTLTNRGRTAQDQGGLRVTITLPQ